MTYIIPSGRADLSRLIPVGSWSGWKRPLDEQCAVHEVWAAVQRDLCNRLGSAGLSDLVSRARDLRRMNEERLKRESIH